MHGTSLSSSTISPAPQSKTIVWQTSQARTIPISGELRPRLPKGGSDGEIGTGRYRCGTPGGVAADSTTPAALPHDATTWVGQFSFLIPGRQMPTEQMAVHELAHHLIPSPIRSRRRTVTPATRHRPGQVVHSVGFHRGALSLHHLGHHGLLVGVMGETIRHDKQAAR